MRIFITGGAGFLGSHLCETLIHQRTYDHLPWIIYYRPNRKYRRINGKP